MNELRLAPLRTEDYKTAIHLAGEGMHFSAFIRSRLLGYLYARNLWYEELDRASQVLAVYKGEELAGVLLADIAGERKPFQSFWRNLHIRIFYFDQIVLTHKGVRSYNFANAEMFRSFTKEYLADGEICFFAVRKDLRGQGTGSMLLAELEKREKGRRLYVYADSTCTYQFFDERGFQRAGSHEISIPVHGLNYPLDCFLYTKVCGQND